MDGRKEVCGSARGIGLHAKLRMKFIELSGGVVNFPTALDKNIFFK